jgi:hypothetical protein
MAGVQGSGKIDAVRRKSRAILDTKNNDAQLKHSDKRDMFLSLLAQVRLVPAYPMCTKPLYHTTSGAALRIAKNTDTLQT